MQDLSPFLLRLKEALLEDMEERALYKQFISIFQDTLESLPKCEVPVKHGWHDKDTKHQAEASWNALVNGLANTHLVDTLVITGSMNPDVKDVQESNDDAEDFLEDDYISEEEEINDKDCYC